MKTTHPVPIIVGNRAYAIIAPPRNPDSDNFNMIGMVAAWYHDAAGRWHDVTNLDVLVAVWQTAVCHYKCATHDEMALLFGGAQ